jgi:hypothetical protein
MEFQPAHSRLRKGRVRETEQKGTSQLNQDRERESGKLLVYFF